MTAARLTALPMGLVSTMALLLLMASLIQTDFEPIDPPPPVEVGEVVMPEPVIETRYPEPPARPEAPPKTPAAPEVNNKVTIDESGPGPLTMTFENTTASGPSLNVQGGDYLPMVKVSPQYPPRAARRGIEGEVVVSYTVTTAGATRDVQVVEAVKADGTPTSVFDRAAISAAEQFKYKPRVVDGEPREVYGVQNRFIFQLD